MAGPMPVYTYPHRSSSPGRGLARLGRDGKTFGLARLSWRTFQFSRKVAKMLWLLLVKIRGK